MKIDLVTYFPNSVEKAQGQFLQAISLGLDTVSGDITLNAHAEDFLAPIYITDFLGVTEMSNEIAGVTIFSLQDNGEYLAKLVLNTLQALDWTILTTISETSSPYFEQFSSSFLQQKEDYGILVTKAIYSYKDESVDPFSNIFDFARIVLLYGDAAFIQINLNKASSSSFSSTSGNNLIIATHNCNQIAEFNSDCGTACRQKVMGNLSRAICIDESNLLHDKWFDDKWSLVSSSSANTDYRVLQMYDNAVWLAEAAEVASTTTSSTNLTFNEHLAETIGSHFYSGISRSNPFQQPTLSINEMHFGSFQRVLSSDNGKIDSISLLQKLTIFGGVSDDYPKDYSEYDYGMIVLSTIIGLVFSMILLLALMAQVATKKHIFRFGILSQGDGLVVLALSMIILCGRIMNLLEFINPCIPDNVVFPSIRFGAVCHIFICHYEFHSLLFNKTWKSSLRLPLLVKVSITSTLILVACLLTSLVDNWSGYGSNELLIAVPNEPAVMASLCENSYLWKSTTDRWLSSLPSIMSCFLVSLTLLLCIRMVVNGGEIKGFKERWKGIKSRGVTLAGVTVFYLLKFVNLLGAGQCVNEKRECSSFGNGSAFVWGSPFLDVLFIIFFVCHSIQLEMWFNRPKVESAKGVHTFLKERRQNHVQTDIDRKVKLQEQLLIPLNPMLRASHLLSQKSISMASTGEIDSEALKKLISSSTFGQTISDHVKQLREELIVMNDAISAMDIQHRIMEAERIANSLRRWLEIYFLKEKQLRAIMKKLEIDVGQSDILLVRLKRQLRLPSRIFALNV
eukprot:TRINITY_DN4178_c2_g1_i1.p1 TRINITY_DN4178_c2_g1~~TRINITY_DN4178_c2_g1_i1.p1  ORF type:complete len:793 (-),score=148.71 TRINITY_DN4178_c2_g1_i1:244-2622(-)